MPRPEHIYVKVQHDRCLAQPRGGGCFSHFSLLQIYCQYGNLMIHSSNERFCCPTSKGNPQPELQNQASVDCRLRLFRAYIKGPSCGSATLCLERVGFNCSSIFVQHGPRCDRFLTCRLTICVRLMNIYKNFCCHFLSTPFNFCASTAVPR